MTDIDYSEVEVERGRKLFAQECQFMLGVVKMDTLPDEAGPEVAFAGRSNVGKSSLLNALTNHKNLARASNTPGRTQEINYFDLGGEMRLVDLPGYGYAKAARKNIEAWTRLTRDFLRGRVTLRRVCLLIDSRHGFKPPDIEVMDLLDEAAVIYQIVLTKTDKIKPTALVSLREHVAATIAKRPAAYPSIFDTSSQTGDGLSALRADLASLS